jgi:hypothetical protein
MSIPFQEVDHWSPVPLDKNADRRGVFTSACGNVVPWSAIYHNLIKAVDCPECRSHPEFKKHLLRETLRK